MSYPAVFQWFYDVNNLWIYCEQPVREAFGAGGFFLGPRLFILLDAPQFFL